ncbi:MAG: peptidase M19 [Bacteroidetes bacterium]|nr:peptidase M19 [Bacteroidota bacterium]
MKKLGILAGVLAAVYLFLLLFASRLVDGHMNGVISEGPHTVNTDAQALYDDLDFIADLHCDALLWRRPMRKKLKRSHVDLPKMQEAHVSLQVFTVVSKSPHGLNFDQNDSKSDDITLFCIAQGRPLRSWFNIKHRVGFQSSHLHRLESGANGAFKVVKNRSDLQDLINANKDGYQVSGGLFGLEGAHPLKGEIKNIDYIYDKGARMVGLVHFFDNELGGSAHGIEKGGLTDFGRACIREFEERNIIIDLAHASEQLIEEVLAEVSAPVVVSHTGVRGTCDRGRNLSDEQIKGVAATGGLIGIGFFDETMCGMEPSLIIKGIAHVRDLVGIEHVALGSDFDGSVITPFDVTGLPIIVEELLKAGFTEYEVRRVMGENVRDFLLENLPA